MVRKLSGYFEKESRKEDENPYIDLKKLKRGRLIYHRKLKQKGVIQSVDIPAKRISVMLGNIKVSARIQDIKMSWDTGLMMPFF